MGYWFLIYFVFIMSIIMISSLIISSMNKNQNLPVNTLMMIMTLAMIIIIISDNIFSIFLSLEMQTFSSLILIAKNSASFKSMEASMKYFMLGSLSSGFFLLGIYLLYTTTLSTNLIQMILEKGENNYNVILMGKLLILFSLFFKLGVAPLHFWLIDVYESLSWDTLMIIGILPKVSYLTSIVKLFPRSEILLIIGMISIVIGTLGAFNQTKIKSLLAYSAVSHSGFYLMILTISSIMGIQLSYFYFLIYLTSFLTLVLICYLVKLKPFIMQIAGVKSIFPKVIFLIFSMTIFSLAGIPPFAGFLIKWFFLWYLITNQFYWVSFFIMFFSVLVISFYLNMIKVLWFQENDDMICWMNALKPKKSSMIKSPLLLSYLSIGLLTSLFLIYWFQFMIVYMETSSFLN